MPMRRLEGQRVSRSMAMKLRVTCAGRNNAGVGRALTCNFFGEADAAGAVDAAGHNRLDQWAQVLVSHRALHLREPTAVAAEVH